MLMLTYSDGEIIYVSAAHVQAIEPASEDRCTCLYLQSGKIVPVKENVEQVLEMMGSRR